MHHDRRGGGGDNRSKRPTTSQSIPQRDPADMGWYFTRQDLSRTPSVTEEMSDRQVKVLLTRAIEFLQNVGMKLRLPQLTIATAVVYFQRFYVVHSLKKYDIFKIAATSLFLAGKVEETPKKLRDVVITAWEMDPRRKQEEKEKGLNENSIEFASFRDKVLEHEREILRTLAFNLAVDHPYRFLLQSVKAVGGSKELAHFAWNFINDSLKTNICLQYKPHVVACAVLDLTSKAMKLKLPGPPEKAKWWYEEPPHNVTPIEVEDVCDQLLSLYEGFTQLKQKDSTKLSVHERLNRDPGLASKVMSVGTSEKKEEKGSNRQAAPKRERESDSHKSDDQRKHSRTQPPPPPPPSSSSSSSSSYPPSSRSQPPPPPHHSHSHSHSHSRGQWEERGGNERGGNDRGGSVYHHRDDRGHGRSHYNNNNNNDRYNNDRRRDDDRRFDDRRDDRYRQGYPHQNHGGYQRPPSSQQNYK